MKKLISITFAVLCFASCGSQKPLTDAQYELSVRRDMPFTVSEFKQVKPDVYVLQGETKNIPNGFHWDVTDQRHMLNVAPILEEQTELSVELLKTLLQ